MKLVYDDIEDLMKQRNYNRHSLALRANIPPTTFAAIMKRRSYKISIYRLEAIANVFEKHWYDLLNIPRSEAMRMDTTGRTFAEVRKQIAKPVTTTESVYDKTERKNECAMEYLRPVNSIFYSYFDSNKKMLFVLKRGARGILGYGLAWYLSVTFGDQKHTIATFTVKDDGYKCYKEDYEGRLWGEAEVLDVANKMIGNML